MKNIILNTLEFFYIIKRKPRLVEFNNNKFGIRIARRINIDLFVSIEHSDKLNYKCTYFNGGNTFKETCLTSKDECIRLLNKWDSIPEKNEKIKIKRIYYND